jgi:hypothetical protein
METYTPQNDFISELNRLAETYRLHRFVRHGHQPGQEECNDAAASMIDTRLRAAIHKAGLRLKKSRHRWSPRYTVLTDQKAVVADNLQFPELYDFVQAGNQVNNPPAETRPTGLRVVGGTDIQDTNERI